jgi:2-octaprenyl-6-methoxyphenol hydroxylase
MQFDVIIIGGGMVGAAMACALQNSPLKIALIDASPLDAGDDHRLIALNHSSICILSNLKIWPALSPHAAAIQEIHVSHRGHFGMTKLHASDANLPFLGYVVPAKFINKALYEQFNNVTLFRPATLNSLQQDEQGVTINVTIANQEQELTANVILGADGTQSTVRQLLNIATQVTDYQQSALVTTTTLSRSHQHVAYERFQQQGAIAMLPLQDNAVATIWTDSTTNIAHLLQLDENAFLEKLQNEFGYRLGKLQHISARYTYPLRMVQAEHKIKQRVLLLGNAAHTLHPIAAQGLNLALFEVAVLADYFLETAEKGVALKDFASSEQSISTRLSHQLSSVFSHDFLPINTARSLGMIGLDLCQPLKKYFIQKTLGHSQSKALPSLIQANLG